MRARLKRSPLQWVFDTRPATQVGTRSTPLGLAGAFDLVIPGLPDDATGVNINVTVVEDFWPLATGHRPLFELRAPGAI